MAVAFLWKDEEILFLQKRSDSLFLPGLMVPIGGHMEPEEIHTPNQACLREIEEETGLTNEDITELKLRYIVLRMKGTEEIRMQYVYLGQVKKEHKLIESAEGNVFWIHQSKAEHLHVTETTKEILKHFHKEGKQSDDVYVGSMKSANGKPDITWGLLEDWELLNML